MRRWNVRWILLNDERQDADVLAEIATPDAEVGRGEGLVLLGAERWLAARAPK